jgi:hypothetical protein
MNKTQLQLNNEILTQSIYRVDNLIEIASSLPEAGGGSGSGLQTCTVTLAMGSGYQNFAPGAYFLVRYAQYTDDGLRIIIDEVECTFKNSTQTFYNVLCNSLFMIEDITNPDSSYTQYTEDSLDYIADENTFGDEYNSVYLINSNAANQTVNFISDIR